MSDLRPASSVDTEYQRLLGRISEVCATGQVRAHQAVNVQITETYWQIGIISWSSNKVKKSGPNMEKRFLRASAAIFPFYRGEFAKFQGFNSKSGLVLRNRLEPPHKLRKAIQNAKLRRLHSDPIHTELT